MAQSIRAIHAYRALLSTIRDVFTGNNHIRRTGQNHTPIYDQFSHETNPIEIGHITKWITSLKTSLYPSILQIPAKSVKSPCEHAFRASIITRSYTSLQSIPSSLPSSISQISSPIITLPRRFYRRRFFRESTGGFNRNQLRVGFNHSTRLEEKFQPGSTHVVSAHPVPEFHESGTPPLIRYRWRLIRMWRRFFKTPRRAFFTTFIILLGCWAYIFTSRFWNITTLTRRAMKGYMATAGLSIAVEQLGALIEEDLIEFQSQEAKAAFIGLLHGVREDVRKELDENLLMRLTETILLTSLVQPVNTLIKPIKQNVYHQFQHKFKQYNRLQPNLYWNNTSIEESQMYRISNEVRIHRWKLQERYRKRRRTTRRRRRRRKRKYRKRHIRHLRQYDWGPLWESVNNIPAYYFLLSIVGLTDLLWLRDTRYSVSPSFSRLFQRNEMVIADQDFMAAISKLRGTSNSRIRDANALYRELERFTVPGDYVKMDIERIENPQDPLLNHIPLAVLNSSDKTFTGPLFYWYSRKIMDTRADIHALYRRLLTSEFLLLNKIHEQFRKVIYITIGQKTPPPNVQRYMKYIDETNLYDPKPPYQAGDLDFHIGDEGMWDEIYQYALFLEDRINETALHDWLDFGNSEESFEPNHQITESIEQWLPPRVAGPAHIKAGDFLPGFRTSKENSGPRSDDYAIPRMKAKFWEENRHLLNKHEIQLPDRQVRPVKLIRGKDFQPAEPSYPWPEGFFTDNPPLDDPLYYTRKFGLGTKKDWERMVRLGVWEEYYDPNDPVNQKPQETTKWDEVYLGESTMSIHPTTLEKFNSLDPNKDPGVLWLQFVERKLKRARQRSSFPLLPLPHELVHHHRKHRGTQYYIDIGAKNDLYSSNMYSGEWLLFVTMPSITIVPKPLHEMNFLATLLARLEGCIMQNAAEMDNSNLASARIAQQHPVLYEAKYRSTPDVRQSLRAHNQVFKEHLDSLDHYMKLYTRGIEYQRALFARERAPNYTWMPSPTGKPVKRLLSDGEISLPFTWMWNSAAENYFRAKIKRSPIDPMKQWFDYHLSDAKANDHLFQRDGRSTQYLAMAKRALGETDLENLIFGSDGRYNSTDLDYMRYKKRKFLDYFGSLHGHSDQSAGPGRRFRDLRKRDKAYYDYALQQTKDITLDNYKQQQRDETIFSLGLTGPKASPDFYSFDKLRHNYNGGRKAIYIPY